MYWTSDNGNKKNESSLHTVQKHDTEQQNTNNDSIHVTQEYQYNRLVVVYQNVYKLYSHNTSYVHLSYMGYIIVLVH